MKPEDLIPPFTRNERKTLIHDRIWYLPEPRLSENTFVFPGWEHPSFFGNSNPVCIEYCSGNGAWIAEQALANPDINWVAIEIKFKRVRKIWSKIKNHQLNNLIVICGEAHRATEGYFPLACTTGVFINFPDPWPKNRHAKNRLIQPRFVKELARIIRPKNAISFVTDDPDYSQEVIKIFLANPDFQSHYPTPYFSIEENNYGSSFFDELWRSKGKTIRYHRFIKNES